MKKILCFIAASVCLLQILFFSCNKGIQEPTNTYVELADEDLQLVGELAPYRVDEPVNDKSTIGFIQFARLFTLEASFPKSKSYLEILKKAKQNDVLIKVFVFKGTTEIAKISEVAPESNIRYKTAIAKGSGITTKESLPIIPNETALNNLFNAVRSSAIAFPYVADGCFARAHLMRQIIVQNGYECAKQFIIISTGALSAQHSSGCCVQWGFHVAPLVRFRNSAGAVELRILDPSLFSGPATQQQWFDKCKSSCGYVPGNISTPLHYGYVYNLSTTGQPIRDDNYMMSNCVNGFYRNFSGCSFVGYPPC